MSVISNWLENTFNQIGTYVGKQIAPMFGQDPKEFEKQQQIKPSSQVFTERVVAPIARETVQRPGVAPIIEGIAKGYDVGIRRPFTTLELLFGTNPVLLRPPSKMPTSIQEVRDAWELTKNKPEEGIKGINVSQATAETLTGDLRNVIGQNEAVQKYFPWLKPDFDITDPKQRTAAFEDSWAGAIFTGGLSLLQLWGESKGSEYLFRLARTKTGLQQSVAENLTNTNVKLDLTNQTDEAVKWYNEGMQTPTPNGVAAIIKDYVPETNVSKIESSPFIQNLPPEIRFRTSNMIANSTSAEEIGLIMRSHWGDTAAFNKLWDIKAPVADAINDFGLYDINRGILDNADRLNKVIDDLAVSDPKIAEITKSWADDMGQAIGTTNWAPSKFASIEEARNFFSNMRYQRRYGVATALTKYEKRVKSTTIQSNLFTRPVHILQNLFNEKPRGMVGFSDPRGASDAVVEILSEINRVKYLRGPQYAKFKQDLAKAYGDSVTDTQRKVTLKNIEQDIALNIGRENNIPDSLTLQIFNDLKNKTDAAQNYVAVNGHVPLSDTSIVLPDPLLRSQMVNNYILLDFKLLDRAIKDFKKTGGTGKKQGKRKTTDFANLGDYVNNVFSHVALIRPGYIPKNSIVEPAMRILALGDATRMLEQSLPATKRLIENNFNRGLVAKDVIWDTVKGKTAKRFREKIGAYKSDIFVNTKSIKDLESKIKELDKKIAATTDERYVNAFEADKEDLLLQVEFHQNNIKNLNELLEEVGKEFREQVSFRAKLLNKKTSVSENARFTLASGEEISVPAGRATAAKGGAAMQSEIDPSVATWQAAGQTFAMSRMNMMRNQIKQTTIRPNDKDYWNAYAKDLNVNVKNDEVVKMWASGVDRQSAMAWLRGERDINTGRETIGKDSGLFYSKQILEKRPEFLNQDWEEQFVNEVYDRYDILVPDSQLRNELLDRNVSALEFESAYGYKTNLPEIDGNMSVYPQGAINRIANYYNNFASWGYSLITAPERILFRNTFYDMAWNDSIKRQIAQAERMGVEVTPQLVNDRYRFIANAEAINKVEQTFYTVRRNNNLNYALRFLTGFPTAVFNSYKFWAKNIAKNPYNAVLQYKFQNLPYDMGTVVDQDGNTVRRDQKMKEGEQRYLLLGQPAWADRTNLQPYQKKLNVQQWNFLLGSISGSWIIQVGLSQLVSNEPAWAKALQDVVGKGVYNQLLFGGRPIQGDSFSGLLANVFSPGYLDIAVTVGKQAIFADLLEVTKDEPAFANRVNILWNTAMFNWAANGYPEGQQPKLSDVEKLAYRTLIQDALEKWASPITPTNQPVGQFFKDQRQILIERYKSGSLALPAGKTPYQAATDTMSELYGIDVNRFYVSSYSKATNMESSQLAYNNFKNHKDLVKTVATIDPMLIGIITNPDTPGEYDPAVGAWMQRATVEDIELAGGKKTFNEIQADFEESTGFREYSKLKDKYAALTGGQRLSKFPQLQAQFEIEKEELAGRFPAWGVKMQSGYQDRTNNAIMILVAAITNPKFMAGKENSRKWQAIYTWVSERENVYEALKSADAENKKRIREYWADREQDIINSDTSFADFHAQYLDNDKLTYGVQHFANILKGKNK